MDPSLAALVARFVDGEVMDVRAECGRLGVSTKTFYKYRKRFLAEGVEGFFPRSRRPHHNPRATDPGVAEAVLLARKELDKAGWDAGADQIGYWLSDHPDRWTSPGPATTPAPLETVFTRGRVSASGCLGVNRQLFSVGRKHAGQDALLIRQDRQLTVFVGNQLVAELTLTGKPGYQQRKRHSVIEVE